MLHKRRPNQIENLQPSGFEVRHQRPERCVVGLEHTSSHEGLQSLLLALLNHLPYLRCAVVLALRGSKCYRTLITT